MIYSITGNCSLGLVRLEKVIPTLRAKSIVSSTNGDDRIIARIGKVGLAHLQNADDLRGMARPKECWRIKEDAVWAANLCHGIGADARRNDAHVNKWITTPLLRGHQYCAALQMCTNT